MQIERKNITKKSRIFICVVKNAIDLQKNFFELYTHKLKTKIERGREREKERKGEEESGMGMGKRDENYR